MQAEDMSRPPAPPAGVVSALWQMVEGFSASLSPLQPFDGISSVCPVLLSDDMDALFCTTPSSVGGASPT